MLSLLGGYQYAILYASFHFQLTTEQVSCVSLAKEGHNFMIYGEAGTGKSLTVNQICQSLQSLGRNVQVVCSTGVACDVYKTNDSLRNPPIITGHSFLDIHTVEASFGRLVSKATSNTFVKKRIKALDTVMWDEISMTSTRVLDLFHAIAPFKWTKRIRYFLFEARDP